MSGLSILGLLVAAPFVLFPVAFVWYINGGGLYRALKRRGEQVIKKVCSMDTDCPPGHVCVNGRCVPAEA